MKTKLTIVLLILFCLPAVRPLLKSGFFTMHDDQQVVRLHELNLALSGGQFPVRWVSNLGFGYGYPLFNFYPPLVYYLAEIIFLLLGTSYITAIKIVMSLSFILSALTMYLWSRHHIGNLGGLMSALFYTYAPYRAVDIYVRGALAEAFSFVWLPLILLAVDHLTPSKKTTTRTNTNWVLILIFSYAALMITHNLIVLPFTLLLPVYILFRLIPFSSSKLSLLPHLAFAGIASLTLTAFFWLPALTEKQFTLVDTILLTERYSHEQHFVEPSQLWNSLWGYGGSSPDQLDGFSLKIGKLHLVLSALAGFYSLIMLIFLRKIPKHLPFIACFLLLCTSAFLTTRASGFIWSAITPLQFLQFPWRFLTFTVLFSSFLSGATLNIFHDLLLKISNQSLLSSFFKSYHHKFAFFVSLAYFSLIVFLLFLPNLKLFTPQTFLDVTDSYYTSDQFIKWKISKTSFEFIPRTVATTIDPALNITQIAINPDQIANQPFQAPSFVQITTTLNLSHKKTFTSRSDQPYDFQLNTYFFPGWQARINNQTVPISNPNPLSLITIPVPSGQHNLSFTFTNTPIRTLANLTTVLTTIMLGLITYRFYHISP